jgi:hypothetical protein
MDPKPFVSGTTFWSGPFGTTRFGEDWGNIEGTVRKQWGNSDESTLRKDREKIDDGTLREYSLTEEKTRFWLGRPSGLNSKSHKQLTAIVDKKHAKVWKQSPLSYRTYVYMTKSDKKVTTKVTKKATKSVRKEQCVDIQVWKQPSLCFCDQKWPKSDQRC